MTNTKKKKNNTKKLLGAIGMLSVSAAMLVSSTFAWFSLNKKVTAASMNVKAKSYNPYLLINEVKPDTTNTYDTSATMMTGSDALELKLVKTNTIGTHANMTWQEATAASPAAATKQGDYADVTLAAFTGSGSGESAIPANPNLLVKNNSIDNAYVLTYELFFKTANDTPASNLKLAEQSAAGTDVDPKGVALTIGTLTEETLAAAADAGNLEKSVRILFVNQDDTSKRALFSGRTNTITYNDSNLADSVTNTDGSVHLRVYMYFDGDDAAAFTNNAVELENVIATFGFVVADSNTDV